MSDYIDFDQHPELVDVDALNNFPVYCPGGIHREPLSRDIEEIVQRYERNQRTKLRDVLDPDQHQYYSEINLHMTRKEFHDLIDALILESGMTLEEIESDDHGSNEIRQKLLPVYLKMRQRGFLHNELVT